MDTTQTPFLNDSASTTRNMRVPSLISLLLTLFIFACLALGVGLIPSWYSVLDVYYFFHEGDSFFPTIAIITLAIIYFIVRTNIYRIWNAKDITGTTVKFSHTAKPANIFLISVGLIAGFIILADIFSSGMLSGLFTLIFGPIIVIGILFLYAVSGSSYLLGTRILNKIPPQKIIMMLSFATLIISCGAIIAFVYLYQTCGRC